MNQKDWVLLVEDDPQTVELTGFALGTAELGCRIVVAHDGLEALDCLYQRGKFKAAERGPPRVMLLDLKMPRVNGFEVLRQVKSDADLRSIPVVMLTSSCEESDVRACYRLGVNAFVVKPVEFQKFTRTLRLLAEFWTDVNVPPPDGVWNSSPPKPSPAKVVETA